MSTKPILVCMVWRGGDRFARCLRLVGEAAGFFSRVVISVEGNANGLDMQLARATRLRYPFVEVICIGTELPTMQHQAF